MQWLMIAGGAPNLVILVFGLIALVAAIGFAREPATRKLPYIAALVLAVLFSTVAGVCTDLAAVSVHVAATEELQAQLGLITLIGLGESLAPAILGMSLLSIVALVLAIGLKKLAR